MLYDSKLSIELMSMFRWKENGWKSPVSLMSPDMVIRFSVLRSCENNRWTVTLDTDEVIVENDLVDESLKERLVAAVKTRCSNDIKVIQIFGDSMRRGSTKRLKSQSNMFYPTNYRIDFNHAYRFIVALDGVSTSEIDGVYLVPSYLPAPAEGYDKDSFYKMLCYERL